MKKKVIYLQEDDYSCGPVCIQSIVAHYGGYVPLETVLDDTGADATGTSAYALTRALRKYGFTTYGRRIDLEHVDSSELPFIAHVVKEGLEHFLVVYAIDADYVLTMDPACGEIKYDRKTFEDMYDDKSIFAFPDGEIPHYKNDHSFLRYVWSKFLIHKMSFLAIAISCIITLLLSLCVSFHFKVLSLVANPFTITVLFFLIRFVILIVAIFKDRLSEALSSSIDYEVVTSFTEHIFRLPLRFIARKKTGQIVKKIQDASFVKNLILRMTITNTLDVLMIVVAVVTMAIISAKMTGIYLFIAGLLTIVTLVTNKRFYKKSKENVRRGDDYMGSLVEFAGGLESIKNLNREEYVMNSLASTFAKYNDHRRSLNVLATLTGEFKSWIMDSGLIISNLVGFLSLDSSFTFYDLVTLQSLFALFAKSLESILETVYHLSECRALFRSLCEFLDIDEESTNGMSIGPIDILEFTDLSYSHDGLHRNFEHLNYTICRGDKILVRGPSGVGKSTLVKCLCGILENYSGTILMNGIDLKALTKKSVRSQIIYVGQEETLFTGSIEENITAGAYDEQKFKRVIEITSLKNLIENRPAGQRTTVLEGASNISGGERARIILARALYENPSVLIIDETLSSVSEEMEDEIISHLMTLTSLSVIYITHRNKKHLFAKTIELKKGE